MSEETETVAEPQEPQEQHEHHPKKQNSGGSGAFMAIVLAIGALGASYYLWQQQQITNANAKALEGQVGKLLGVIEQRQQELLQRMQTVPKHQHPEISQRLDKMQATLFELRSHLGQERRDWQVAEVDYLLRIADHRLRLERDVDTAIAALQTASQRLQNLNNPAFAPVINLISNDISKLAAVHMPDRDKLASQIATLESAIDNLPLAVGSVQSVNNKSDKAASDESEKRPFWQKIWHDILGLVTIRRQGEVTRPMLVPEQRYFLKQNLQLRLESARLALLAGNEASWRASLSESADWLRRYFDNSATPVQQALGTLNQLSAVELNPPLPELANTRKLLQQASMQMPAPQPAAALPQPQQQAPAKTAPPATEKPAAATKPTPAKEGKTSGETTGTTKPAPAPKETTADKTTEAVPQKMTKPAPTESDSTAPAADDVPQLPQGTGQ